MPVRKCEKCGHLESLPIKIRNTIYWGLVKHHKVPRHKNGRDIKKNRILVCEKCHQEFHSKNGKLNWAL
jgi:hypothetical protein